MSITKVQFFIAFCWLVNFYQNGIIAKTRKFIIINYIKQVITIDFFGNIKMK